MSNREVEIIRCKDCKHKPSGDATEHDITFPDDKCPCQCEDLRKERVIEKIKAYEEQKGARNE